MTKSFLSICYVIIINIIQGFQLLSCCFDIITNFWILESGIDVGEIGCGTGILSQSLAKTFPNSRIHGSDVSDKALAMAREGALSKKLENVTFEKVDICNIPDTMVGKFEVGDIIALVAYFALVLAVGLLVSKYFV